MLSRFLREKFGEDVEVKVFEKSKGWLGKKIIFLGRLRR